MALDMKKNSSSKCPILIGGLIIMCLYLLCDWWSLSSQNAELMKQLDTLAEQFRINGEELDKCSQQRMLLDEKLKDSQNRFVQQQITLDQVKESEDEVKESYQRVETELQESKKKNENAEKNLEMCQAEMESLKKLGESKDKATETLRTENESLKSEISEKDTQIKELKLQVKNMNNTGNLFAKSKFIESLVKNYNNAKKNLPNTDNDKVEKHVNVKIIENPQNIEGEQKNDGDSGGLLDKDPREEEMKES